MSTVHHHISFKRCKYISSKHQRELRPGHRFKFITFEMQEGMKNALFLLNFSPIRMQRMFTEVVFVFSHVHFQETIPFVAESSGILLLPVPAPPSPLIHAP